jgi:hypothetical protein
MSELSMTKPQLVEGPGLLADRELAVRQASPTGVIVLGTNFKSKRRERTYDADKIWSGEHTILDYSEI